MRPDSRTRWLGALALCSALLFPETARAQGSGAQQALAAQALYDQAIAEMDAKSYATACPKLEEATRLIPEAIGAKMELGKCYEALGKLASAWSQLALAATMATRAGQADRAKTAAARAAALRPRLATLTIQVAEPVQSIPGVSVLRDGVLVGSAQWETALPVDAGGHKIVVAAPGYKAWTKDAEVVADGVALTVSVQKLELEKADPALPKSRSEGASGAPPWDRTWQRPIGLAAIATGTAGLSAGALLGILAITRKDQSNQGGHCDARNACDAAGLALRDEAVGLGDASTVAFAVGGALLAGGVVLFATAPPRAELKSKATLPSNLAMELHVRSGGVQIVGQW